MTDTTWSALAAPVPLEDLRFRQDGSVVTRDGRHLARFVVYLDAGFVRRRLDEVAPGCWTLRLMLLPPTDIMGEKGEVKGTLLAFRARLTVHGVVRESIGSGRDYKAAETDAFKRAAARFGIGGELRRLSQFWVPMDGNGRDARPTKAPRDVYRAQLERSGS